MNDLMLKMYVKMQSLKSVLAQEEGQDLVEYALVVALIALGAVVAMKALSAEINTVFGTLSTTLSNDVS